MANALQTLFSTLPSAGNAVSGLKAGGAQFAAATESGEAFNNIIAQLQNTTSAVQGDSALNGLQALTQQLGAELQALPQSQQQAIVNQLRAALGQALEQGVGAAQDDLLGDFETKLANILGGTDQIPTFDDTGLTTAQDITALTEESSETEGQLQALLDNLETFAVTQDQNDPNAQELVDNGALLLAVAPTLIQQFQDRQSLTLTPGAATADTAGATLSATPGNIALTTPAATIAADGAALTTPQAAQLTQAAQADNASTAKAQDGTTTAQANGGSTEAMGWLKAAMQNHSQGQGGAQSQTQQPTLPQQSAATSSIAQDNAQEFASTLMKQFEATSSQSNQFTPQQAQAVAGAANDTNPALSTASTSTAAITAAADPVQITAPDVQGNVAQIRLDGSVEIKQAENAQPQQHTRPNVPTPNEQVDIHIRQALQNGLDRISVRLEPAEMGRLDIRIEIARDGAANIMISADRQDTLDMMQKDSRELARMLQQSGIKADSGNLNFSLRDEGGQPFANNSDNNDGKSNKDGTPFALDNTDTDPGMDASNPYYRTVSAKGLDISV